MAIKNLGRVTGKSAYEIWLEQGNTGTEEDFLNSLKADSSGETHNHDNKTVLDSITQEDIDNWNNGNGGTSGNTNSGLSTTEKTLMLSILKNAIYNIDVSSTITQLEALWESTGDGGTVNEYSITNILSNVLNDNSTSTVIAGQPYTANLTPYTGYKIYDVIITMGGKNITSLVYNDGVINISNVTDDVIITANGIENNILTYKIGKVNGTTGLEEDANNRVITDFIECNGNETVTFPNNYFIFYYYDINKNCIGDGRSTGVSPWFFENGTMNKTCAYMRILCLPDLNNPNTVIEQGSYDDVKVTVGNTTYSLKEA